MGKDIIAKFQIIKDSVQTIDKNALFMYDIDKNKMSVKSKNLKLKADIEANIGKITATFGLEHTNNHTTGTLKFNIKL